MTKAILRSLLIGSSAALLAPAPAVQAQGQNQNVPLTFGFSQSFQSLTNPDFSSPSSGTSGIAISTLSFDSSSFTPTDSLIFSAGIGLGVTRNPDGSITTAVNSPNVALDYSQTTSSSVLTAFASFSIQDLAQLRLPSDFTNAQGQIVLPSNPADLVSYGLKQDARLGGSLELGRDGPFGLTLNLAGENISYSNTTDPALQDINKASAGVKGRFNYSPQGDLTLGYNVTSQVTLEQPQDIYRTTQNVTLGTGYEISPLFSVSASARYQMVQETGFADSDNISAQIGANYTYQTGSLGLSFASGTGQSDLSWQQNLVAGGLSVDWTYGPDNSGNGTLNQVSVNYNQTINDVSGLNLGLFYSSDVGSTTTPDVTSSVLIVGYNHQLTQDWDVNVGANFRLREPSSNDPSANASSTGIFLTIGRNWSFGR